jgi:HSP20 family molecular chaperone IbpA
MTLANSELSEALDQLNQTMQSLHNILLRYTHKSVLWVGNAGIDCISRIESSETDTEISLHIYFPSMWASNLEIEVTQETVLIRGRLSDSTEVAGYFSSGRFQSIIPLPHAVRPETVEADCQPQSLTLRFSKLQQVRQQRIKVNLSEIEMLSDNVQHISGSCRVNYKTTCS